MSLDTKHTRRLQSFHMGCQRQILGVRWQDHVKNVGIVDTTGLPNITNIINKKRHALFGHVVIISYHIIMYISEALVQKHQRRGSKQTGKFSAMLQMYFKYFDKKVFKILF